MNDTETDGAEIVLMTSKDSDVMTMDTGVALKTKEGSDGASAGHTKELVIQRSKSTAANVAAAVAANVKIKPSQPHPHRARAKALAVAAAVLAIAAGGWCVEYCRPSMSAAPETPAAAGSDGKASLGFAPDSAGASRDPSARVETIRAEMIGRHDTLRLTGALAADEKSEVGSNAAGNISETRVERGSFVKKGDVLVQIDPARRPERPGRGPLRRRGIARAAGPGRRQGILRRRRARGPVGQDHHGFGRTARFTGRRASRHENAIALESYDQSATDYRAAVQRYYLARRVAKQLNRSYRSAVTHLVTLRKAVDDCTIRAPFDGVVAERNISVGERVIALFPGAKLVTLVRIDPLRLSLTVPAAGHRPRRAGPDGAVPRRCLPEQTFKARVRFIAPVVTSDTRSMVRRGHRRRIPDRLLRPGLFATAELQLQGQATGSSYRPVR